MSETEFSREVAALRPALALTAQRYLHDPQAAEDVVQDALLRLWQIRDTLQLPIQAFAQVLVRNLSIDTIRRRHPQVDVTALASLAADVPSDDDRYHRVMQLVDHLPSMQQTLFRLRHIEQMSYADISAITGSSEAAVRKAISRARQSILQQYQAQPSCR